MNQPLPDLAELGLEELFYNKVGRERRDKKFRVEKSLAFAEVFIKLCIIYSTHIIFLVHLV